MEQIQGCLRIKAVPVTKRLETVVELQLPIGHEPYLCFQSYIGMIQNQGSESSQRSN